MSFSRYLLEFANENPGKAVGAVAGLILGIAVLAFGFAKTLVIILFIFLGYVIGKMVDDKVSLIDAIKRIFRR